jgi:acyl-coenzyme A synthetase/AMP-(fatty) acid ligase/acyl carrier protein
LLSAADSRDNRAILSALSEQRISHVLGLPSLHELVLEQAQDVELEECEAVIVAGEACPPTLPGAHAERWPEVALYNEYGPTEATVWSTAYRCASDASDGDSPVPIGRSIPNTTAYVLDEHRQPRAQGARGELCLGGDGITRGYWEQPGLTAERFIPDPFAQAPGSRRFLTGDLARYRADGQLIFCGRIDHQVKIRGHRIELGEIEFALTQHPQVREAAVLVQEGREGTSQLIAYMACASAPPPSSEELREWLRELLPGPMIPSQFFHTERLLRTQNGKIDRESLLALEAAWDLHPPIQAPPHTKAERQVAEIWQEFLGLDRVSIDQNFFDLGGDSLLILRIRSRLETLFAREIPVIRLFEHSTVYSLAKHLEEPTSDAPPHLASARGRALKSLEARKARQTRNEDRGSR